MTIHPTKIIILNIFCQPIIDFFRIHCRIVKWIFRPLHKVFRLFGIVRKEYFYFCPSIKPKSVSSSANHFLISSDVIAEVLKTNNRWHKSFADPCFVILCNTMIYFSINHRNIVCVHQLGDFWIDSSRYGSGNLWSGLVALV